MIDLSLTPGREFIVELPAGMVLPTANHRHHRFALAGHVRELRAAAGWQARAAKVPALERVHITGLLRVPSRVRRDPANWAPAAKAAVDGLVDAGVLADDDHTRVLGPDMRLSGERWPAMQLVLIITELPRRGPNGQVGP